MLTIALCDDDPGTLSLLRGQTERFISALPRQHQPGDGVAIKEFPSGTSLIDYLEEHGAPDIALLDICMPGVSGMQAARAIRNRNGGTKIIFLTSSQEYAIDAFALNAVHYLVKPFSEEQFSQAMSRTLNLFKKEPKRISVNGGGESVTIVNAAEIQFIESIGHRRYVHTAKSVLTETHRTLTQFALDLERLCPGQFIQPYRGYIVNLAAVRTITSKGILVKDGTNILIKPGDFRMLKEKLFAFTFAQDEDAPLR